MPPIPPARRQAATPAPAETRPLSARHQRFLALLAHPDLPIRGLTQASLNALPQRCRQALARITPDASIDPWTRRALEAYYASGHKPTNPASATWGAWDYTEDARRATALMQAPHGDMSTFLLYNPASSDKNVEIRLMCLLDAPELKAGDKVRLEALRLLLQLKGHLKDEKSQSVQATQIVIHTSQEPAIQPAEQRRVIEIEL